MTEIKSYYSFEKIPLLNEIKDAFEIVLRENVIVEIIWTFPYSGTYKRLITPEILSTYTPEEFWEKEIPHIYGV